MALPTTINSAVGLPGPGPRVFKSSGDNFYTFSQTTSTTLDAYKATDPTASWAIQDAANNPSGFTISLMACYQVSDVIHIAYIQGTGLLKYNTFNMATDAWVVVNETIVNPTNAPTFPWLDLAVRSDSTVVVVMAGDTDQVMGGKKERVDAIIRSSGGTWGSVIAIDANADEHYGMPTLALATDSDDIHIMWASTDNTADPPTAWLVYQARTLRASDDSLSTTVEGSGTATTGSMQSNAGGLALADSGQKIRFLTGNGDVHLLEEVSGDIAWESTAKVDYPNSESPLGNGETVINSMIGPDANGDIHIVFANSDADIYYLDSTDTGDTWTTEVEILDAVTCNFINANIYVRGSDTVLAYVYDDAGTTKYNEHVIIEGGLDISPGLITAAGSVFSPTITVGAVDISPGIIAAAGTVFNPTVATVSVQDISPGIITAAGSVFSPTLTTTVDISPGIITAAGSVFNPTLTTGVVDITPPLITAAGNVPSPTVTTGVVDISPGIIAAAGQVFSPTLTTTVDVSPSLIVAAGTTFSPTITTGAVDISPALIAAAGAVFSPTVSVSGGTQFITPGIISAAGVVFSPTLDSTVDISPSLVSAAGVVFNPVITTGSVDIAPALISATGTVEAPTISVGSVDIAPGIITASGIVFSPTIDSTVDIAVPLVTAAGTVFLPTVTTGAVDISPSLIPAAGLVFSPTLTQGFVIAPDFIGAAGTVFSPTLTTGAAAISPGIITNAGVVFGPVVTLPAVKEVQIEFAEEQVIAVNGGAKTFYFNGTDYFEI